MYPVLNIHTVMEHTERLYSFIDAARRNGLVQQGFPGADAIDDENTITLKMILACTLTMEGSGRSELGQSIFESPGVREAVANATNGYMISNKAPRLLVLTVSRVSSFPTTATNWSAVAFIILYNVVFAFGWLGTCWIYGKLSVIRLSRNLC